MDFGNPWLDTSEDAASPSSPRSRWQSSHLSEVPADLWQNEYPVLPDSWSQTLDSLLGDGSTGSSPETNASVSGDSATLFSSAASNSSSASSAYPTMSGASQSGSAHRLSLSPSDPFDLNQENPPRFNSTQHALDSNPFADLAACFPEPKAANVPLTFNLIDTNADSATQNPVSYVTTTAPSMPPAFRLLLKPTHTPSPPITQNGCIAPADLALNRLAAPAPMRPTAPLTSQTAGPVPLSLSHHTPAVLHSPYNPLPPPPPRGLAGWTPPPVPPQLTHQPNYSLAAAIVPGLKPPCPRPSAGRLAHPSVSSAANGCTPPQPSSGVSRRTRRRAAEAARKAVGYDNDQGLNSDDAGGDSDSDSDSDVYQPSSSPGLSAENSRETSPSHTVGGYHALNAKTYGGTQRISAERHARRGKGKAKGSAALALAVVTQMSQMQKQQQQQQHAQNGALKSSTGAPLGTLLHAGDYVLETHLRAASVRPGCKRKNTSIPLPVPVPHLIKKSRGRKVPYVAGGAVDGMSEEGMEGGVEGEWEFQGLGMGSSTSCASTAFGNSMFDEDVVGHSFAQGGRVISANGTADTPQGPGPTRGGGGTRSARGRKTASAAPYSLAEGGKRTYMCEVPGCGKCFVRGEHLKRHVRSIHTYDKPHPCPYNGCDKTFSRRDNLGQHVRVHLQV